MGERVLSHLRFTCQTGFGGWGSSYGSGPGRQMCGDLVTVTVTVPPPSPGSTCRTVSPCRWEAASSEMTWTMGGRSLKSCVKSQYGPSELCQTSARTSSPIARTTSSLFFRTQTSRWRRRRSAGPAQQTAKGRPSLVTPSEVVTVMPARLRTSAAGIRVPCGPGSCQQVHSSGPGGTSAAPEPATDLVASRRPRGRCQ